MRDLQRLVGVAKRVALFTSMLWVLLALGPALPFEPVARLGLYPRELAHLHGVLTAPLVHGSIYHLAANTPPLFVLGTAMLYSVPRASRIALPLIWIASGIGVWLFGRASFHVGISGLTHGMMFFLLLIGLLRRDRTSIALAMIVSFLYGGMVWGVLPQGGGISFEYHLAGALAGLACAWWLCSADPLGGRRLYEPIAEPPTDEDDPVIGDLWREPHRPASHSAEHDPPA